MENAIELLVRGVVAKICKEEYKADYMILLKQMGEMNDNFNDGLRFFIAKLYSRDRYKMSIQASKCLGNIYSFFVYNKPLELDLLKAYVEEN